MSFGRGAARGSRAAASRSTSAHCSAFLRRARAPGLRILPRGVGGRVGCGGLLVLCLLGLCLVGLFLVGLFLLGLFLLGLFLLGLFLLGLFLLGLFLLGLFLLGLLLLGLLLLRSVAVGLRPVC